VSGSATGEGDPFDRLRRRVLWAMPTGLYVIGSHGTTGGVEAWNLMTANLVVQVSVDPKQVGVSIDATARTRALIEAGGAFSVCLLAREDRALVRRFVKPVTDVEVEAGVVRTMAGEPVRTAATGCPVLERSVAWLDCEVRHRLDLGSHLLFVGEVVDAGGPDGTPPPVLRMEDTRMNYGG